MTQSIHSALPEAQAPMHAPSASPPRTHAQASRDSHWTTPSGQRRPLPGDPCAESPPRPKAPQPGHADAPNEVPQSAPSGESATRHRARSMRRIAAAPAGAAARPGRRAERSPAVGAKRRVRGGTGRSMR